MKNNAIKILVCAGLIGSGTARAQQIIASTGGSGIFTGGESIDFTLGESVVTTNTAASHTLDIGFHQITILNTLPVGLIAFKGVAKEKFHSITWNTKMELNNSHFVLEYKSHQQADFSAIATIASKADDGNSFYNLSYSYNNYLWNLGNNYYRLQQVDKDGKVSYSEVIVIKADGLLANATSLYPNPVINDAAFRTEGTIDNNATLKIINSAGQTVKTFTIRKNDNLLALSDLIAGSYTLSLANGDVKTAIKFIKL